MGVVGPDGHFGLEHALLFVHQHENGPIEAQAGGAAGLGFNRAILMLVDEEEGVLKAEMAVGPDNAHQAEAIWSELSGRYRTLQDFLQDYDRLLPPSQRPLADLVQQLVVPLRDSEH